MIPILVRVLDRDRKMQRNLFDPFRFVFSILLEWCLNGTRNDFLYHVSEIYVVLRQMLKEVGSFGRPCCETSPREISTCITRPDSGGTETARDAVTRLNRRKIGEGSAEHSGGQRKGKGSAVEKRIKESGWERKIRRASGHRTNSRWLVSLYAFPGIGLIYTRTRSYLPRSVTFS